MDGQTRGVVHATKQARFAQRLKRRHAAEARFRFYGIAAIGIAICFLIALFVSIIGQGYSAFTQSVIKLEVAFDQTVIDPAGDRNPDTLLAANYEQLARDALRKQVAVESTADKRKSNGLLSRGAPFLLRDMVVSDPSIIGTTQTVWVPAHGDVDALIKGHIDRNLPEAQRRLDDQQTAWVDQLVASGTLSRQFNWTLFTSGASSNPEQAGIGVAIVGSAYMMLIVLLLALPIGVLAAVYLEEFARKNRWTDLIEVNINNLAAVPSIVFGLLGLAVFINFFGLPRSAPLVGGLVLTLLTLPTIIITTRASIRAVPPSIKQAALGLGASRMQAMFHHTLPLAAPGILTGTILGLAHALGETAPLLMIGMVAFVVGYPATPLDPATALPVQVYMWSGAAERGFVERTSAGIIVLLVFLIIMNSAAVWLRRKFERRW